MALYVSDGARKRNLVLAAVGALVLGLVIGFVAGRATSTGLEEEVSAVQDEAIAAATGFQRLPIEYEQAVAGEGGESAATIDDAIDSADDQLQSVYSEAIWLPDDASAPTDAAVEDLRQVVADQGSLAEFEAAVDDVVQAIEATFGVTAESAG
jgi:hypothetical protein